MLITNGSLQGSRSRGLLSTRGWRVLVEGPTYDRALHIPRGTTASPSSPPIDDEGLDPDALELPAAFLYTIPTFQNPSGRTLSLERRQRASPSSPRDGKLLVLEDDPYSLVRYEGEPLPTSTSSPAARASSTPSRSRRSSRPGSASATWSASRS